MNDTDKVETSELLAHSTQGEVTLGTRDPRTLAPEEFSRSTDLLYHGSRDPFVFSPDFNYASADYFQSTDGSQTLGEGFYTTDDKSQAENYSRERKFPEVGFEPVITTLLPYQARMFDFRQKEDPRRSGDVPKELFTKWHKYYADYRRVSRTQEDRPWWMSALENGYMNYLARLAQSEAFTIRQMLETAPAPALKSRNLPNPPWSKLFANFMKEQGYDGIIEMEGGEGPGKQAAASFVFFNLRKIGTYETWHQTTPAPDDIAEG